MNEFEIEIEIPVPPVTEEAVNAAIARVDHFVSIYTNDLPGGGEFNPYDEIYLFLGTYRSRLGMAEFQPVQDRLSTAAEELTGQNPDGAKIIQRSLQRVD